MRLFDNYFWGGFLVLAGVLLMAKYMFHLNFPTGRVILGLFIILIGVSILFGGYGVRDRGNIIFNNGVLQAMDNQKEYNVIFSNGVVDLTNIPDDGKLRKVQVNVIFGNGTLKIDSKTPATIKMNAAFAKVDAPNGNSVTFGDNIYRTGGDLDGADNLIIEANAVFGKLDIVEK